MTPHPEVELLLDSFKRNGRVNDALLNAVSEEDLTVLDEQGGWSIGQHLGHLADFRHGWLSRISPTHAESVPVVIEGDEQHFYLTVKTVNELRQAFSVGDEAAMKAVMSALDEGRSFSRVYTSHPVHFLQHCLVHDAHHRGQIMSLLRKSGRTVEQMDELDGIIWPVWKE